MTKEELPSRLSIGFGMLATGSALICTAWIGTGLWSEREAGGFVLGIALSLSLLGQTAGRLFTREGMLREQRRREAKERAAIDGGGFPVFRPATGVWPPRFERPDVTVRMYPESQCPTEVIHLGPFRDVDQMDGWIRKGPGLVRRTD